MNLTNILAVVGTVTGCSALFLQLAAFLLDRSRLAVEFHFFQTADERRREYFRLQVVLKNTGRRPVRILSICINLPKDSIPIDPTKYKVVDLSTPLYDARKEPMIVLEEHGRQELCYEHFELSHLRSLAGKRAKGVVTDSLDRKHTAWIQMPQLEDIDRISKQAEVEQRAEASLVPRHGGSG